MTARGILYLSLLLSATLFAQQKPVTGKTAPSSPKHATAAATKPADPEAAKVADIRRLLEVTGTRDMVNQMKSSMMEQFRRNAPGISTEMLDEMMAELKAEDLLESMIPVYSKHFTGADIKQLIAFYQSPFGKKVLREMPQIITESGEVGTRWSEGVVTRVATRWRDQGKISQRAYEQLIGAAGAEDEH
jgi:uncharacterized protein